MKKVLYLTIQILFSAILCNINRIYFLAVSSLHLPWKKLRMIIALNSDFFFLFLTVVSLSLTIWSYKLCGKLQELYGGKKRKNK